MIRLIAFLTLLFMLRLPSLPVQTDEQSSFADLLNAQMPGLLADYHVPGAVAAYIRDGDVAWTEAYGVANTRSGAVMQPEMIMNFGSCGKVLTAWGVMRLVEEGKIGLDSPANRYLKRWKVELSQFDPDQVTVGRLLSHTAGLTVHGFSDYSAGRRLPALEEMLAGKNQMDGQVKIQWKPGTEFQYSGGGYVLLQMIIEDVTGETFEAFMQREVIGPLGLTSLHWTWTPMMIQAAAMPHGSQGEPVGYRQLASPAIGSEISTTADFARFITAAVAGPNGEPPGRGVLSPETIHAMIAVQPNTNGSEGLAYGVATIGGDQMLMHFGSNLGWNAFFILDTEQREGLVISTNSANGFELLTALQDLWVQYKVGKHVNVYPPANDWIGLQGGVAIAITALLTLAWLPAAVVFMIQLRAGKRLATKFHPLHWLGIIPWVLLALFWWYWVYSPSRTLLPTSFPDVWPLPQAAYVLVALLAWVGLSVGMAIFAVKPGNIKH